MSFAKIVKNRELAYITKLLSIFGAVEERQMRELFSHLDDKEYGKIMARLHREGLVYRTPDAKHLTTSRYSLEKVDVPSSVRCFWAFIKIKNKVQDFCSGSAPAIITVASNSTDYDLIPVSSNNATQINESCEEIPEATVRFLVTENLELLRGIERRIHHDYALLVDDEGVAETFEL